MELRIVGETPKGGKPLCTSCRNTQVVRGQNGQEVTKCTAGVFSGSSGVVTFPVYACSVYTAFNSPSLYEMEQIAWQVQAHKKGPKGFELPADGSEMEVTITPPKETTATPTVTDEKIFGER